MPITPFRRTIDAVDLQHTKLIAAPLPPDGVNKWQVLKELTVARTRLDLSDRALAVLQALLSFHPETILDARARSLIVFPSNAAICERLNGMALSTMRRHLATLVKAGLVLRRDSPNGKRFARRYGKDSDVFGFDLTPLVVRFREFSAIAATIRAQQDQHDRLRRRVSLMRRDLAGLATYGAAQRPDDAIWDQFHDLARLTARDLRRKLNLDDLAALEAKLKKALHHASAEITENTADLSINEAQTEHHHQKSNKEYIDSDSYHESTAECSASRTQKATEEDVAKDNAMQVDPQPNMPLTLVLSVCNELLTYSSRPIRHWRDFIQTAQTIYPMMGISASVWSQATRSMGAIEAAVVIGAMLERFADIRSPGGYLRHLSKKAEAGNFSSASMILALTRREAV